MLLMTLLWKFSVMTDSVNGFFQDPHRFQDFFLVNFLEKVP